MWREFLRLTAILFFLAGCETQTATPSVPVLLSNNTLGAVTIPATAPTALAVTPTVSVQLPATRSPATPDSLWNLPHWWLDAKTPGMLTATLLPTRTPFATETPTLTRTPTHTPSPTASRTPTRTASPSPGLIPNDTLTPEGCVYEWFFKNAPQTCPTADALIQPGIFLTCERGAMIWLGTEKSIVILFNSVDSPRWLLLPDPYQAGMTEFGPGSCATIGLFPTPTGFWLALARQSRYSGSAGVGDFPGNGL